MQDFRASPLDELRAKRFIAVHKGETAKAKRLDSQITAIHRWNRATDQAIDNILVDSGISLPKRALARKGNQKAKGKKTNEEKHRDPTRER